MDASNNNNNKFNEFMFLKSMISWKELAIFLTKILDCNGGDISGDISMGGPPSIIGVLVHLAELRSAKMKPFPLPDSISGRRVKFPL